MHGGFQNILINFNNYITYYHDGESLADLVNKNVADVPIQESYFSKRTFEKTSE